MYVAKYALTQYRVVLLTSYYGADIRATPYKWGARRLRNVCYGNAGCLATELRPVTPRIVELRTSQIGGPAHHKTL